MLFSFILCFYFILFYVMLCYYILCYFYFLFYFLFYFILFYFILFYFILFYFILFYAMLFILFYGPLHQKPRIEYSYRYVASTSDPGLHATNNHKTGLTRMWLHVFAGLRGLEHTFVVGAMTTDMTMARSPASKESKCAPLSSPPSFPLSTHHPPPTPPPLHSHPHTHLTLSQ